MKLIIDTSNVIDLNINLDHHTELCRGCTLTEKQIIKTCQVLPEDYSVESLTHALLPMPYDKPSMGEYGKTTLTYHDPLSGESIKVTQVTTERSNLIYIEVNVPGLGVYTSIGYEGSRGRFSEILDLKSLKGNKQLVPDVYQHTGPVDMKWYEDRKGYIQRVSHPGYRYPVKELFDDIVVKQLIAQRPDRTRTDEYFLGELSAEDYKEFEEAIYNLTAIIDRISGVNKMVANDLTDI